MGDILWLPRNFCRYGLPASRHDGKRGGLDGAGYPADLYAPDGRFYIRRSGSGYNAARAFMLVRPGPAGLPYGGYAKLILGMLCTRILRAKLAEAARIDLGSIGAWCAEMGIDKVTGGERGSGTVVRDAFRRLVETEWHFLPPLAGNDSPLEEDRYHWLRRSAKALMSGKILPVREAGFQIETWKIATDWDVWTDPERGWIDASDGFVAACGRDLIPCDRRALLALKGEALALNLYLWLQHAAGYAERRNGEFAIRLPALAEQIGGGSGNGTDLARQLTERTKAVKADMTAEQLDRIGMMVPVGGADFRLRKVTAQMLSSERETLAEHERLGAIGKIKALWPQVEMQVQEGAWSPNERSSARLIVRMLGRHVGQIGERKQAAVIDEYPRIWDVEEA